MSITDPLRITTSSLPPAIRGQEYEAQLEAAGGVRTYDDVVMLAEPFAYWPLDDAGGTVARDLVGNFPGTYVGGAAIHPAGGIGDGSTSAAFDGSNTLWVETGLTDEMPRPYSLEIMVFQIAGQPINTILAKTQAANPAQFMFRLALMNPTADQGWAHYVHNEALSGSVMVYQRWTHLVATVQADQTGPSAYRRLWKDGVLDGEGVVNYAWAPSDTPLRIGNSTFAGQPFRGSLAKAAVYDYILTDDQIIYHAQAARRPSGVRWSIVGGALPLGLTLDEETGLISGTPE